MVTKRVKKLCFGGIYNGRLWEKEVGVSVLLPCGLQTRRRADCV